MSRSGTILTVNGGAALTRKFEWSVFIRKFVLPLLLAVLAVVIYFAIRNAMADQATRIQSLSAIASSISAMIAVVVALWTDIRERSHRRAEQEKSEAKVRKSKKRLAALYSAEMMAWRERKDIEDVVSELGNIEDKDLLTDTIKLRLVAKRPALAAAKELDANFWHAEISEVARALRLGTFDRLSSVPNIWTTQFRREDVDILEGDASSYFVVMGTIWTNLMLKAQQLYGSVDILRAIRKDESYFMPSVVDAIAEDAVELREHLSEFLRVAKEGAVLLANYPEDAEPESLKTPLDLLAKSRDPSQRLSQAWHAISVARLGVMAPALKNSAQELVEGLNSAVNESGSAETAASSSKAPTE
jgi:hypothetical protein